VCSLLFVFVVFEHFSWSQCLELGFEAEDFGSVSLETRNPSYHPSLIAQLQPTSCWPPPSFTTYSIA
jgi:hypothetical protein